MFHCFIYREWPGNPSFLWIEMNRLLNGLRKSLALPLDYMAHVSVVLQTNPEVLIKKLGDGHAPFCRRPSGPTKSAIAGIRRPVAGTVTKE